MWAYLAVLLLGFWLGVAIFLYVSCYWLEEILDLPPRASASSPSSGASGAHAQLKRLVARVVEEATSLPALARYAADPPRTPPIESSTYEDLLATAILNKVIERYQNENGSGGRSSGIHSASASPTPSERSSPRSLHSRHNRDLTPPLREEDEEEVSDWEEGDTDDALELPRRVPFPEFGGDIVHRTAGNEERNFDEVSGSEIQAIDGTWEENWLFQKKRIKTIQSVPVPMLVPNSNTEYRALIGDRDADDTTDLSDNGSDAEDEAQFKSDIKKVLESKHVIGGKTKIDDMLDFEPDSLTIIDGADDFEKVDENKYDQSIIVDAANNKIIESMRGIETVNDEFVKKVENGKEDSILVLSVDSGPLSKTEFSLKEEIHRTVASDKLEDYSENLTVTLNGNENMDVVDGHSNNENNTNTLSRHEREGEYEETVTVPVQRYADSLRRKHFDDEPQQIPTRDTDNEGDLIPGSIAYRERKKWLNYVEMPNNPYSPEAIQKRLNAKNTSSFFDMIAGTNKNIEENQRKVSKDVIDAKENVIIKEEFPVKAVDEKKYLLTVNINDDMNGASESRYSSPSPKILKDILAEEIPQYKRYGRDYYIKEAKAASGGRRKNNFSDTSSVSSMHKSSSLDNFDSELASPGLLIKQINTIATNQHYTKFADKTSEADTTWQEKTEILIEYEDVNEHTLFSAEPALIDEETDKKINEILEAAYNHEIPIKTNVYGINDEIPKSPVNADDSYISSSSLEDSIKVYNVQTGEIVKCKDDNVSLRYEPAPDGNYNIDTPDNNIPRNTIETFSYNDDGNEDSLRIEVIEKENSETESAIAEEEEILKQLPSVKELAKKFVSMDSLNGPSIVDVTPQEPVLKRRKSIEDLLNGEKTEKTTNKQVYMHSLTARSISKEFREGLKMSLATPLQVPGGLKQLPEGANEIISESTEFEEPLPQPGTLKSKLAFFESLKSRISKR